MDWIALAKDSAKGVMDAVKFGLAIVLLTLLFCAIMNYPVEQADAALATPYAESYLLFALSCASLGAYIIGFIGPTSGIFRHVTSWFETRIKESTGIRFIATAWLLIPKEHSASLLQLGLIHPLLHVFAPP